MKCFHFSSADAGSRVSRLSWARSLSIASTSSSSLVLEHRRAELDPGWDLPCPPTAAGPPEGLRAFAFSELKAATRGFGRSLLIGEGGFGCVYRGVVTVAGDDGAAETMDVAVKQLNRHGLQGHQEWVTEVNFLGVVKHPNLVKLVGFCAEDDERGIQRLLVYELMRNKSLEDHLLSRVSSALSWPLRLKIALDAAHGLAYLHEEMDFQLIFRDFKTSNILLDEDFNAKLSDFGFARHGPTAGVGHVETSVVGTVGYAAPEYIHTGKLTAKSDVWSFGVVLYELLTGRRSLDRNLPRSEQKLLEWVKPFATDPKKLYTIMDPRLEGKYCLESAQSLVALANRCLKKQPKSRPRMSEVVEMLDRIIKASSNGETTETITSTSISLGEDAADTKKLSKDRSSRSRVFEIKDMFTLKNNSVGRLYWRSLASGPIARMARTWP
ncbi:hypothetical protein OPV22_027350 [Ensete ventricosum]|uniref:non-specific serine/threonine protein kinase n=1 Tax=Ensete ventricosum TaxID=4639 RepID=A0AAV8PV30_ENSVE|nr:hypothetical protein OPV22_027350 [Ensete ventricosum]